MKDTPLDEVLKQVLKGTGYSYSISNDRIFLTMAKEREPEVITVTETTTTVERHDTNLPEIAEFKADTVTAEPDREWKKMEYDNSPQYVQVEEKELPDLKVFYPSLKRQLSFDKLPTLAIKTNLLYDLTSTFNLGAEVRLLDRYTFDLSVNYNPWTFNDNKKISHLMFQPELRYWLCESFKGHFFGLHAQYARFNVGGVGFTDYMKDHRFQGDMFGAGFSYGYQWYLSPRWSLEATVGFGYNYLDYKRYECKNCGNYIDSKSKNYFGPTKAGVSLIYMIK